MNPEGVKAQLPLIAGAGAETAQVNPEGVKAQLLLVAGAGEEEAQLQNVTGAKKEVNPDRRDLEREEAHLENVAGAGSETAQVNPEGVKAQLLLVAGAGTVAEDVMITMNPVKKIVVNLVGK